MLKDYCMPSLLFQTTEGGGGASGNADSATGDSSQTFTQEQLNSILATHKRGLQQQLDKLTQAFEAERAKREETEDMLINMAGGEEAVNYFMEHGSLPEQEYDDDGDESLEERAVRLGEDSEGIVGAEDVNALIRGIEARAEKRLVAMQKRLEEEISKREETEAKNLSQQRDAVLADALIKNNAVDVQNGLKIFRDHMEYDQDEDKWQFKSKDGLYMDPDAGVAEALPDYMRKPLGGPGGSGARGSSPSVTQTQLMKKKEELANLQKRAVSSGDDRDVAAFQKISREVRDLERLTKAAPEAQATSGRPV